MWTGPPSQSASGRYLIVLFVVVYFLFEHSKTLVDGSWGCFFTSAIHVELSHHNPPSQLYCYLEHWLVRFYYYRLCNK